MLDGGGIKALLVLPGISLSQLDDAPERRHPTPTELMVLEETKLTW